MKRILSIFLAAAVAGCGSSTGEKQKSPASADKKPPADKKRPADDTAQPPAPPAQPTWPPKIESDPSAFADVPAAIAALRQAAAADDPQQTTVAVAWLANQGAAAVDPLAEIAMDESAPVPARYNAVLALGYIAEPAVPTLIDATGSPEPLIRRNAIKYLGLIHPADRDLWRQVVLRLVELMHDDDQPTRIQAIQAIGATGIAARNLAERPLQAILDDGTESNAVRRAAGEAIKQVAPRRTLN